MIRPDPEREGVYVVDVSDVLLQELREGWSRPVQVMIEDDELVLRVLDPFECVTDGPGPELETVYRIPPSRGTEAAAS